jgi:electron transfer flavoprotein alpha subunit
VTTPICALILHKTGVVDDSAVELLSVARKIDPAAKPIAVAVGFGEELDSVCQQLGASYQEIWKVKHVQLAYPNAELVRQVLQTLVPVGSIVLCAHEHFGIDLCPGLSVKLSAAYVSDIVGIDGVNSGVLNVIRQEFGGQVSAHVQCDISSGAVITVRPGAFKPIQLAPLNGTVIDKSSEIGPLVSKREYLSTVVAESGDVDITKQTILVSVGRGIQEKDNISIAEELAEELGAAVSCSRPVVDAKWLEKSRQVGTSGKTVKPKVYIACGISGAFQHIAGLKGNPFIVAINKNPKAPIFQVADIGIVDDLLEFLPELTNKIRDMRTVSAK